MLLTFRSVFDFYMSAGFGDGRVRLSHTVQILFFTPLRVKQCSVFQVALPITSKHALHQ